MEVGPYVLRTLEYTSDCFFDEGKRCRCLLLSLQSWRPVLWGLLSRLSPFPPVEIRPAAVADF